MYSVETINCRYEQDETTVEEQYNNVNNVSESVLPYNKAFVKWLFDPCQEIFPCIFIPTSDFGPNIVQHRLFSYSKIEFEQYFATF